MRLIDDFNYIEQLTGIKPDIEKMARIGKEQGGNIETSQIDARLQSLFQQELLNGNIDGIKTLEEQFGRQFTVEPADLQMLYTQVLMTKEDERQHDSFNFLLERTSITPSPEIIQARYKELFAGDFRPENVGTFQEMVKIPPSNEIVQSKYQEIFSHYIQTNSSYDEHDEEGGYVDHGDRYFDKYAQLVKATGIRPQFGREYAIKLYEFCVTSGPQYHQKLIVVAQETGISIDQDFIRKYILDNSTFYSPVPFSISKDQLDAHFFMKAHTTLPEYERIYQIFGCFDYYQDLLSKLEQDESREAKQQVIAILAVMGLRDMENEDRYVATKERLLSFAKEKNTPINKSVAEALAALAKNGDADLLTYLASTLRERTRTIEGNEEEFGVMGFSLGQEVALRTLFHVNNPVANEQLLSLLTVSDIDPRVRSSILRNLITEKRDFLPDDMRAWAETELLYNRYDKSKFPWENLGYLQATLVIPSAELRKRSLRSFDNVFGELVKYPEYLLSDFKKTHCPSIPNNVFVQLYDFAGGTVRLLEQFNELYEVTKSSTQRDVLLVGIVNAISIGRQTLSKIVERLSEIHLVSAGGAVELGTMLKTLSFLDTVEQELGQSSQETLAILDSSVNSLSELNDSLKRVAIQKIKEVLPHPEITADTIQQLWEQWGSLEPIFVYAGKMAASNYDGTLSLVAEMVAKMDAPVYEGWKNWRYNPQNRQVQEQIGHLSKDQIEVWRDDHFAELGDIMIAATPSDKPKQISRFIEGSLREGHIYNPDINTSDRHKFIQDQLSQVYAVITEHPDQGETIFKGAIELLQTDIERIDDITRHSNVSKLEQVLTLFSFGNNLLVNAKTKHSIGLLGQFLPKEQFQQINKAYSEAEDNKQTTIEASRLIDTTSIEFLRVRIRETSTKYEDALQTDIFDRYGLDKEQLKNLGKFYQKRQELRALLDLYRISSLDVKRIATNRISDRADKKGETLTSALVRLKTYFKDNVAFTQDVENIQAVISQKEDLGSRRRLAMIVTDSPQMLFQSGKFPVGCGSCQNYEGDPAWNISLAGYVADAHTKVAYLIDLNKLPTALMAEIGSKGFDDVKSTIPEQDLLNASIARAITKITKFADNAEPALFIEPTYSSINKGDLAMDKFFNIFLELMVSEPMGIRLVRGVGSEVVRVPSSRNPGGQYEDCAAGNAGNAGMGIQVGSYTMSARIIDKFTPVTVADRQLADRLSE